MITIIIALFVAFKWLIKAVAWLVWNVALLPLRGLIAFIAWLFTRKK